jgi:hypothetical protein
MTRKKQMDIPENIRRALGLASQILEDMPEQLRPESDIEDMRQLLASEGTGDTGRDGLLICQAIATALAWRTRQWPKFNPQYPELINERWGELTSLFEVVRQIDARTFALTYSEACNRFANAEP